MPFSLYKLLLVDIKKIIFAFINNKNCKMYKLLELAILTEY